METIEFINEMRQAVKNNELQVLTIENVKELIGKHIQTIYFGYAHQDHTDDFVVGEVISEYERASRETMSDGRTRAEYWESYMTAERLKEQKEDLTIITAEGRDTYIRYSPTWSYDGEFYCSDVDRCVYFRVID